MDLVLIASEFPYAKGGDNNFLIHEINSLSQQFEKIFIINTHGKNQKIELPENVYAKKVLLNKFKILPFIKACFQIFSKESINEFHYAKKHWKEQSVIKRLKAIFKYYYAYNILEKQIIQYDNGNTIFYSYWLSARAFALAKLKKQGKIKGKCISRCHGFDCYMNRNYLPFRRQLIENFQEIYFISEQGKTYFEKEIYPCVSDNKAQLKVSRLGLEIESNFADIIQHTTLNLCSCSNIIEVKRLDLIIDSLAYIENIQVNWTHFGTGVLEENIIRYAKERLDNKLNIQYSFAGWHKPCNIMEKYSKGEFDLLINLSDSEGIPVSIMEANAFGVPAIARNVGGNGEIVFDKNLLLNANVLPSTVAQHIENYWQLSFQEKQVIRQNVRENYLQKYSQDNYNKFCESIKDMG